MISSSLWHTSLSLAKASFKLKNEGTWLGIVWYLLSPLLIFTLLLLIFMDRLGASIESYPLYLLLGIIIFNYFQQTTSESVRIIRENSGIIKSINFPKESLVIAGSLKNLFSHLFEIILIIIFLFIFDVNSIGIIFYPFVLILLFMFSLGSSLILASIGTYFFDLDNIWAFASRLLWFATPIFYAVEGQSRLLLLNLLNPMYYFIEISRDLIIYAQIPDPLLILGAVFYSLLALLLGIFIFGKLKGRLAELI